MLKHFDEAYEVTQQVAENLTKNEFFKRKVERLNNSLESASAEFLIEHCLNFEFNGEIALVSSFGTEAAILLHIVSLMDKQLPIYFINTGKIFTLTLRYKDDLINLFDLRNVREVHPEKSELADLDANGQLWASDTEKCCKIRKVKPNQKILSEYNCWITGRKRFHGGSRNNLRKFEYLDGKIKVNPLIYWERKQINSYFEKNRIPRHPLLEKGFLSVGCHHCSEPSFDQKNPRSGRWKGKDKSECGIHLPIPCSHNETD